MLYFVKFLPLDTAVISGEYLLIIFSCFSVFHLAFSFLRFYCPGSHRASRTYSGIVEKRSQADSSPKQVLSYIVIVSVVLFLYCCINVHIVNYSGGKNSVHVLL